MLHDRVKFIVLLIAALMASVSFASAAGQKFTDADFYWDAGTKDHKRLIIAAVNRLHREDARCRDVIHAGTASKSVTRSKAANRPVFFVLCGEGHDTVTVHFDELSVKATAPLSAPVHVDQSAAVQFCEDYAKSRAVRPSTVSFSRFLDIAVAEHPNGRTTVFSSFTAKNNVDVELNYTIRCLIDRSGIIEGHIGRVS